MCLAYGANGSIISASITVINANMGASYVILCSDSGNGSNAREHNHMNAGRNTRDNHANANLNDYDRRQYYAYE